MGQSQSADGGGSLDDVLEHFGIKGMKWGTRRAKTPSVPLTKSHDVTVAEGAKAKIGKRGNTSALSNKELQTVVTRMNLERQYSTLTAQTGGGSPGAKLVKEILLGVGKQQLMKFANDAATKQIAKALAKK